MRTFSLKKYIRKLEETMKPYEFKTRLPAVTLFVVLVIPLIFVSLVGPFRPGEELTSVVGDLTLTAQAQGHELYKSGEIVGELRPGVAVGDVARRYNFKIKKDLKNGQYLFEIPNSYSVEQVVARLAKEPAVSWAEPNYLVELDQFGTDQRATGFIDQRSTAYIDGVSPADFFSQYAATLIQAPQAHAYSTGSGVIVAIIDTGVDTTHPVFNQVITGYDYVSDDWDPSDTGSGPALGHGTHVAGIVQMVAPGATIMPIRAFNSYGSGSSYDIAGAIRYAADHGADVINMSFSMSGNSTVVKDALDHVRYYHDVILVASAGNANGNGARFPANYYDVIGVAATDQQDHKASFSNYGYYVDVCAPGVSIYGPYPGGQWAWWDGTSFSAPMVSGEAAILLSLHVSNVQSRIEYTAKPVGSSLGDGRIDCLAAVQNHAQ
jgi:subtilisin family serine protease